MTPILASFCLLPLWFKSDFRILLISSSLSGFIAELLTPYKLAHSLRSCNDLLEDSRLTESLPLSFYRLASKSILAPVVHSFYSHFLVFFEYICVYLCDFNGCVPLAVNALCKLCYIKITIHYKNIVYYCYYDDYYLWEMDSAGLSVSHLLSACLLTWSPAGLSELPLN